MVGLVVRGPWSVVGLRGSVVPYVCGGFWCGRAVGPVVVCGRGFVGCGCLGCVAVGLGVGLAVLNGVLMVSVSVWGRVLRRGRGLFGRGVLVVPVVVCGLVVGVVRGPVLLSPVFFFAVVRVCGLRVCGS